MEPQPENQPQPEEVFLCQQCGVNPRIEGYPNPLCESCRQQFIRYPIPVWVKGFGIGVTLLVIIGLVSFPRQIMTGIHMRRADKAISEKKYLTAKKELHQVLASAPEMKNAKLDLLIASYYTIDLPSLSETIRDLKDVSFEKNATFNTVQDLMTDANNLVPSDSLFQLMQKYPDHAEGMDHFRSYIIRHPDEPYGIAWYVNQFSEKENPAWCDSMVHRMLNSYPSDMRGLMTAVSMARIQHRYDSALNYCRQLLALNAECTYAISAEARILMARGHFPEGINLAKKACAVDSTDGFSEATLALGYHLNHQSSERDRLISSKASDSTMSYYMDYVKQVMDGKEKFD
jgi:tetratricopeptide (TPR) repeat protein